MALESARARYGVLRPEVATTLCDASAAAVSNMLPSRFATNHNYFSGVSQRVEQSHPRC
jgi:hypothetical protein